MMQLLEIIFSVVAHPWAIAFLSSATVAGVWVGYTRSVQRLEHFTAASYDTALVLLSGATFLSYTKEWTAVFFAAVGAGLSTYVSSRWLVR